MRKIGRSWARILFVLLLAQGSAGLAVRAPALEAGAYRLLSISSSEKLILVSNIADKKKYLLDASAAKITMDGKPVEFESLEQFSAIQVEMELKKVKKSGVNLDGVASEIRISPPSPSP